MFMSSCLPQGDYAYCLGSPNSKGHDHNSISKQAYNSPTIFAIASSQIEVKEQWPCKYLPCIAKVKAVFTNVRPVLFLIPFKLHRRRLVGYHGGSNGREGRIRTVMMKTLLYYHGRKANAFFQTLLSEAASKVVLEGNTEQVESSYSKPLNLMIETC